MEENKETVDVVQTPDEESKQQPVAARRRRSLVAFNANPLAAETKSDNDAPAAPAPGTQKFRASILNDSLPVAQASDVDLLIADLHSAG